MLGYGIDVDVAGLDSLQLALHFIDFCEVYHSRHKPEVSSRCWPRYQDNLLRKKGASISNGFGIIRTMPPTLPVPEQLKTEYILVKWTIYASGRVSRCSNLIDLAHWLINLQFDGMMLNSCGPREHMPQ